MVRDISNIGSEYWFATSDHKRDAATNIDKRLKQLDENTIRAAIEILSAQEYQDGGRPPCTQPHLEDKDIQIQKRAIDKAHSDDEEQRRAAIELLTTYEYRDQSGPIKPTPIRPPPLPWSPAKSRKKRSENVELADKYRDDLRAAIEILSNYEYKNIKPTKPVLIPHPLDPIVLNQPQIEPYKTEINKREALPEEESLKLAIETLSRWEYRNQARDLAGPKQISEAGRKELKNAIELLSSIEYKIPVVAERAKGGKTKQKQGDARWDD